MSDGPSRLRQGATMRLRPTAPGFAFRSSRFWLIALASLVFAPPTFADFGASRYDLECKVRDARAALAVVELDLHQATQAAEAADVDADRADEHARALADQLEQSRAAVEDLRARIPDGEAELARLQGDAARASAEADAARGRADRVRGDRDAAADVLRRATDAAGAEFEASESFVKATAALDAAGETLEGAEV